MNDKKIELSRYDQRAREALNKKKNHQTKTPSFLLEPYEYYFNLFEKFENKEKLLEIGAGMGENTLRLIKMNFNVCATDISPHSVNVMKKRFSRYKNFYSKIADIEKLPFNNCSFDLICSSGSLSYGNNFLVMNEIYRVLKPGGTVIIVDSLNNSLIYRFNRYLNYLKGKRTRSTLKNMPDIRLIKRYIKKFGYGKVKFFGSITWLFPLLKILLSDKFITKFSNWFDAKNNVKKSAFKFVLTLIKK